MVRDDASSRRMRGSEVRAARLALGLSNTELAERLGVRADTLRRWESGRDPVPYGVPGELRAITEARLDDITALAAQLAHRGTG